MTQRKAAKGLDFDALRLGIERRDPDLVLRFYTEDARLSIVNAGTQRGIPFELCGKVEIARHLRAVYGQGVSHRVEGEVVGEDRATFREACEYPDGARVVIDTTLEMRGGKIVRQVDVVAKDARVVSQEESDRGPPNRGPSAGVDALLPDRLLRSEQATEKEDY